VQRVVAALTVPNHLGAPPQTLNGNPVKNALMQTPSGASQTGAQIQGPSWSRQTSPRSTPLPSVPIEVFSLLGKVEVSAGLVLVPAPV
jgi:hypothetical protein